MLTKWPNTLFRPEEQLLGVLFDAGMITRIQIQELTGINYKSINYRLARSKKLLAGTQLIQTRRLPWNYARSSHLLAYSLTKEGVRYVYGMLGLENRRVQVVPEGQLLHYVGLNEIAVRLARRYGRSPLTWLSTREASEELALVRKLETGGNSGSVIRPDAAVNLNDTIRALIEFDNDTESAQKIESKYLAYQTFHEESRDPRPIIWVTVNERRKSYLSRVWEAMKQRYQLMNPPEMLFFVQGEEINWFTQKIKPITF